MHVLINSIQLILITMKHNKTQFVRFNGYISNRKIKHVDFISYKKITNINMYVVVINKYIILCFK